MARSDAEEPRPRRRQGPDGRRAAAAMARPGAQKSVPRPPSSPEAPLRAAAPIDPRGSAETPQVVPLRRDTPDAVIVIGAGAAGLAAALALSGTGPRVVVVERAETVGGKIRALPAAPGASESAPLAADAALEHGVDAGPTVFTMRWVFDELFSAAGATLDDHLTLRPLETLARHRWDGAGGVFDLHADAERAAEAIGDFAGPADARGFEAMRRRAARMYDILESRMLAAQKPSEIELARRLGAAKFFEMLALSPPISMWRALGRYFRDPRLRQLFGRYANYCGSSPFAAPATLLLVTHVERGGVWTIDGGMAALPRAMAALAQSRGVEIQCGAHVEAIETSLGRVSGVRLSSGERLRADAVVFAGDPAALGAGLLGGAARRGAKPRPPRARSLSALVWTGRAAANGAELLHHNLFFSDPRRDPAQGRGGYADEFETLFERGRAPDAPTTYVCAQDRGAPGTGAGGAAERLQILINAPATGDAPENWPDEEIEACQARTFALLRRTGLDIDPQDLTATSPAAFHRLFPGTGGALYGAANHALLATFRRPGARTTIPGLYLASGAAHPGPGVPMASLSGRLAAEAVTADLSSRARRRRAGMFGGMSTA